MKYCILLASILFFLCMDQSTQHHSSSHKVSKAKHSNHRNLTSRRCRWVCSCPLDGEENRTTLPTTTILPITTTRLEQETSTSTSRCTTQQSTSPTPNGTIIPLPNIPNDSLGIGSILNRTLGSVVSSINTAAQNGSLTVNSSSGRGTAIANGGNVGIEAGVEPPPNANNSPNRRVQIANGGAGIAGRPPQVSQGPGRGQIVIANASRLGGDAVAVGGSAGPTSARGGNATFIVN